MDIVVDNELIVEIKAVERILLLHEAQMLTYLRLSRLRAGLLMNFNNVVLKEVLGASCYEKSIFVPFVSSWFTLGLA